MPAYKDKAKHVLQILIVSKMVEHVDIVTEYKTP